MLMISHKAKCKYSDLIDSFILPGGGVGGGPEWSLPADELQTQQLISFSQLLHPASCPRSLQRCLPIGQRLPRLLGEPQGFHLSARTGNVVCVTVCVCESVCASVFELFIIKCFLLQFVYLLVLVFCLESTASALAYFHSTKVYELH